MFIKVVEMETLKPAFFYHGISVPLFTFVSSDLSRSHLCYLGHPPSPSRRYSETMAPRGIAQPQWLTLILVLFLCSRTHMRTDTHKLRHTYTGTHIDTHVHRHTHTTCHSSVLPTGSVTLSLWWLYMTKKHVPLTFSP